MLVLTFLFFFSSLYFVIRYDHSMIAVLFVAGLLLVVSFGVAMGIVVGGLLLCVVTVLTKRYCLRLNRTTVLNYRTASCRNSAIVQLCAKQRNNIDRIKLCVIAVCSLHHVSVILRVIFHAFAFYVSFLSLPAFWWIKVNIYRADTTEFTVLFYHDSSETEREQIQAIYAVQDSLKLSCQVLLWCVC